MHGAGANVWHAREFQLGTALAKSGKEEYMLLTDPIRSGRADLELDITRQIAQRTSGRVHQLQVKVTEDRVVLYGYTASYYVKQLALQAVLDVLSSMNSTSVALEIQIGVSDPCPTERHSGARTESDHAMTP